MTVTKHQIAEARLLALHMGVLAPDPGAYSHIEQWQAWKRHDDLITEYARKPEPCYCQWPRPSREESMAAEASVRAAKARLARREPDERPARSLFAIRMSMFSNGDEMRAKFERAYGRPIR